MAKKIEVKDESKTVKVAVKVKTDTPPAPEVAVEPAPEAPVEAPAPTPQVVQVVEAKKKATFADKPLAQVLNRTRVEQTADGKVILWEREEVPAAYAGRDGVQELKIGLKTIYFIEHMIRKDITDNVVTENV